MPQQIIQTPSFGESVFEASVGMWFKKEGDQVRIGEPIAELHTDKAVQEINATEDGTIVRILKQPDDVVQPGDPLCEIVLQGQASDQPASPAVTPTPEAPSEPVSATQPDEALSQPDSDIIEIQTSPTAFTQTAEVEISEEPAMQEVVEQPPVVMQETPTAEAPMSELPAQEPSVSEMTEPAESSTEEVSVEEAAAPQIAAPSSIKELQDMMDARPVRRERLSRRRITMARMMVKARSEAVMTTTYNEVDMHEVMRIRAENAETFIETHKVKLGLMSFFVKSVVSALKAFPVLNSELQDNEIIYKEYFDIGIAVASPDGLVVPVLRNADQMSFADIEQTIRVFAQKAQDRSFSLDELVGGTFTITNGGVFGSMMSTPILNPPQVGILGMHNIVQRPVAVDGEVVIRPIMYLAVTYDHRVVEGAQAVQFLRRIKEGLESAERLLLGT